MLRTLLPLIYGMTIYYLLPSWHNQTKFKASAVGYRECGNDNILNHRICLLLLLFFFVALSFKRNTLLKRCTVLYFCTQTKCICSVNLDLKSAFCQFDMNQLCVDQLFHTCFIYCPLADSLCFMDTCSWQTYFSRVISQMSKHIWS